MARAGGGTGRSSGSGAHPAGWEGNVDGYFWRALGLEPVAKASAGIVTHVGRGAVRGFVDAKKVVERGFCGFSRDLMVAVSAREGVESNAPSFQIFKFEGLALRPLVAISAWRQPQTHVRHRGEYLA